MHCDLDRSQLDLSARLGRVQVQLLGPANCDDLVIAVVRTSPCTASTERGLVNLSLTLRLVHKTWRGACAQGAGDSKKERQIEASPQCKGSPAAVAGACPAPAAAYAHDAVVLTKTDRGASGSSAVEACHQ
jgi:hypothetical protein